MELKRTFEKGRMNSDINPILLPPGEHVSSKNIDFFSGIAVPMKGTVKLTSNGYVNAEVLGGIEIPVSKKIYYAYTSDNYDGIDEYDSSTDTVKNILKSSNGLLNFSKKITMNLIDNFLFFVDGHDSENSPRRVDVSIVYTTNGFTEDDISVIKPAPIKSPILVMYDTGSGENNIEEKFLSFSYRYKYKTGEYSAYSPFSRIAFVPESFDFDFSTHTNNGMVNSFNSVDIKYNVGGPLVEEVQLLFKESGSNSVKLIDTFNKEELGYLDNTTQTHTFDNSKSHRVMPTNQLARIFDNVPLTAEAQEIIGNRLIYGNYSEGRNIDTTLEHTVTYVSDSSATATTPMKSVKSNRDIEIALTYQDAESRSTTPLVSKDNTTFILHADAIKKNKLKVTIPHLAPSWAKTYRFFIKQSKLDYEVIIPTLFYEDGVYRWLKYEEADKDKIIAGDYLVVKRDTASLITENVEVKILETGYQEANFLRPELTGVEETDSELRKNVQAAGYYFKIKPLGFAISYSDLNILSDDVYHNTANRYDNYMRGEAPSIGDPTFYGDSLIFSGITSSGTYVPPVDSDFTSYERSHNQKDLRFKLTIDVGGSTFSWETNSTTLISPPSGVGVSIPAGGGSVLLSNGVSVVFPVNTGYDQDEYLVISAKQQFSDAESIDRAVACLGSFSGGFGPNEEIEGGAQIKLWVKEYDDGVIVDKTELYLSSRKYENIEEWWNEEGETFTGVQSEAFIFRRGYKTQLDNSYYFTEDITQTVSGTYDYGMHMFIRGQIHNGKIQASIDITQSSSFLLMETRPKETVDSDIFYEIGDTYDVDENRYHLGDTTLDASDVSQTSLVDASVNLRFFNCYSFGNGVESYKVKDAFNGKHMRLDARAMVPIEDYRNKVNISDLTYSEAFSKSTDINRLNEFNLATLNIKELSTNQDGPIRRLATRKGDLIILQDKLISKVMFGRTILSNVDGTSNVVASDQVLGSQTFYSKKFGIGDNAESYAEFGNNFYFADPHNGTIVRGGYSGLDEVIYGKKNLFKDEFRTNTSKTQGVYDLLKDAYILGMNDVLYYYKEDVNGWTTTIDRAVDLMLSMNNRTFGFIDGDIHEFYTGSEIGGSIKTVLNEFPHEVKVYEAVKLESVNELDVKITSDHGSSTITNYEKRENLYYGDIPKSLISDSNKYGLGVAESVDSNNITLGLDVNYRLDIGDEISSSDGVIGSVVSVNEKTLTLDTISTPVTAGTFILGGKNTSIDGDSIRGLSAELDITFDPGVSHKLTAINVNLVKSYN